MKKLAGNDVLEVWLGSRAFADSGMLLHVDRVSQDQRAKIVFEMLRSWGVAAAPHLTLNALDESKNKPEGVHQMVNSADLVTYACELVDAAWSELKHRGWLLEVPEAFNEDEG